RDRGFGDDRRAPCGRAAISRPRRTLLLHLWRRGSGCRYRRSGTVSSCPRRAGDDYLGVAARPLRRASPGRRPGDRFPREAGRRWRAHQWRLFRRPSIGAGPDRRTGRAMGGRAARTSGRKRGIAGLPARWLLAADGYAARQALPRRIVEFGKRAMEGVVRPAWNGRRVLVTGHTGFKGSWLALWLNAMGAKVTGF